ncbi:heparanase isoform X2 [Syngnathoides biaculeatus]|uniref:heparanase isoform X2 n=1 Tax=Syngnathoides biaculeatus TaxID=300417 RepID=UPI002ADD8ACC|nr:heparanase isoform X2 [Syngnathoides biaculeatus]
MTIGASTSMEGKRSYCALPAQKRISLCGVRGRGYDLPPTRDARAQAQTGKRRVMAEEAAAVTRRRFLTLCVVLCALPGAVEVRARQRETRRPGRLVHRVDSNFVSVTIDASLAEDESFVRVLSSPKVRSLAKALAPAFVRFGGTRQDFMEFQPQAGGPGALPSSGQGGSGGRGSQPPLLTGRWEEQLMAGWREQQRRLAREDAGGRNRRVKFTESTLDELHAFANASGLDLVFGLNALLRTADNSWNASNARALLGYCEERRYRVSWELGNEPNSFEKKAGLRVSGEQLGRDFTRLREMMSESPWHRRARLYGPDVGQPKGRTPDLLDGFLRSGADAIDACTWHHYYVNGRDASLDDFLDPRVLDSLALKTKRVTEEVKRVSPGKPVWLGETSSAYGGGAAGLSDTFAAGFMWLDKLGVAAKGGVSVVMRQVLVGSGAYHLLDERLDPLPDFWLTLIHKRVVGRGVLSASAFSARTRSGRVRLYLHCAAAPRRGAVTLVAINLDERPADVGVPRRLASGDVDAFVLRSDRRGRAGLLSRRVTLNGVVVEMSGSTLPQLVGRRTPASGGLALPAYSLGFFVFTDARRRACAE